MRKRFRKFRRDLLVTRGVRNGQRLRQAQRARAETPSEHAAQLDAVITTLERRQAAILRKLKEG